MSKVRGVIEKAYRNDQGFHSINVQDVWYGTYKTDCKQYEGLEVEFDAEQKGKYWNAKGVTPVAGAAPAQGKSVAPQSADARQKSIVLQSSYKVAADMLGSLIAGGHIALGAKGKAYDTAMDLLDSTTVRIYRNAIEPDLLVGEPDDAPGPPKAEYVAHEA